MTLRVRLMMLVIILAVTATSSLAQVAIQEIVNTAIDAANSAIPGLGRPSKWQWEERPAVSDSSLGCSLVSGTPLQTPVTPYRITLTYGETSYVVFVSADQSIVQLCDNKFDSLTLPSDEPTATPLAPATNQACQLRPIAAFANVRSAPTTNADVAGTIYENTFYPITGRNSDASWYRIDSGWVAASVVELTVDCVDIPVVDAASASASGVAYSCPQGFAGYLIPHIRTGAGTAMVEQGGIPNRLRDIPSTAGNYLGEAQPGRVFDEVLEGPACNQGYVWWKVAIDGITGWTVESGIDAGDYFVIPVAGFEQDAGVREDADATTFDKVLVGHNAAVTSLAYNATGTMLASVDANYSTIRLWDLSQTLASQPPLPDITGPVIVDFLPDGRLVSSDQDNTLRLWTMGDDITVREYAGVFRNSTHYTFDLSADGSLIAVGACATSENGVCTEGIVTISNLTTNILQQQLLGLSGDVTHVALSPDGTTLASVSGDGVVLWDVQSGQQQRVLPVGETPINAITFNVGGTELAVASCAERATSGSVETCNIGQVSLWDVAAGLVKLQITQPGDVLDVAFSPADALLATAGEDGIVRTWDLELKSIVDTLVGHTGPVRAVTFGAQISQLASGGDDGTIRLWNPTSPLHGGDS